MQINEEAFPIKEQKKVRNQLLSMRNWKQLDPTFFESKRTQKNLDLR